MICLMVEEGMGIFTMWNDSETFCLGELVIL